MHIPIESLNLQMLNVGLARHDGDWNWQGVNSPFTRIYCVTEGEAWLKLLTDNRPLERDGEGERASSEGTGKWQTIHLTPGHLYLVPAYTTHSYACSGVFCHYYLHVYEGFKNETNVMEMYDFPMEVKADKMDMELLERMCRAWPEARLPESNPQSYDNTRKFTDYVKRYNGMELWEKMWLRGTMLMLMARFVKQAVPKIWTRNERLMKVLAHVHRHIYENISVDELSEVACVSKPYLIRLFKKELGMSPLQYVNRKKVERAQLLLLTEEWAVKEVAYRMGFGDHSYFIRLFRKTTGRTPMEYRMVFY